MNNEFSKSDLVSFGNYLLSEERTQIFKDNPNFQNQEGFSDRLKEVHRADIENWISRKKNITVFKYYILSKLHNHALGVLEETDTTMRIQKLKAVENVDSFSGNIEKEIVADNTYSQTSNMIVRKDQFLKAFYDTEITKDYWVVYEYLTGEKRKAVSENSEC